MLLTLLCTELINKYLMREEYKIINETKVVDLFK